MDQKKKILILATKLRLELWTMWLQLASLYVYVPQRSRNHYMHDGEFSRPWALQNTLGPLALWSWLFDYLLDIEESPECSKPKWKCVDLKESFVAPRNPKKGAKRKTLRKIVTHKGKFADTLVENATRLTNLPFIRGRSTVHFRRFVKLI